MGRVSSALKKILNTCFIAGSASQLRHRKEIGQLFAVYLWPATTTLNWLMLGAAPMQNL
jgi:hypothetical protein